MRRAEGHEPVWLVDALHDLCQPLTALQCQLYLGMMPAVPAYDGARSRELGLSEMRAVIEGGLQECERLMMQVRAMQDRINDLNLQN